MKGLQSFVTLLFVIILVCFDVIADKQSSCLGKGLNALSKNSSHIIQSFYLNIIFFSLAGSGATFL